MISLKRKKDEKVEEQKVEETPGVENENVEDNAPSDVKDAKDQNEKKISKLSKISTIWTIISTIYAIVSTITMISKNWIEGTMAYVLIAFLVLYIAAFIVLLVFFKSDPKKLKTSIKTYKTVLGLFKGLSNVVFLIISAVSMAGLVLAGDMAIKEWVVFMSTLIVAVLKLAFKITLIVFKTYRKSVSKKYKVKISRYVDGKEQKPSFLDTLNEKSYKSKED